MSDARRRRSESGSMGAFAFLDRGAVVGGAARARGAACGASEAGREVVAASDDGIAAALRDVHDRALVLRSAPRAAGPGRSAAAQNSQGRRSAAEPGREAAGAGAGAAQGAPELELQAARRQSGGPGRARPQAWAHA